MPEVTSYTKDAVDGLVAPLVASVSIDGSNLSVTLQNGTEVPVGAVGEDVPFATSVQSGTVTIATDSDISTGSEDTSAVTPRGLKVVTTAIYGAISAVSSAVTSLSGTVSGKQDQVKQYSGSAYAAASGAEIYVGSTDPGTVSAGSIWFDTSA